MVTLTSHVPHSSQERDIRGKGRPLGLTWELQFCLKHPHRRPRPLTSCLFLSGELRMFMLETVSSCRPGNLFCLIPAPSWGMAPPFAAKQSSLTNEYVSHLSGLIKACTSPLENHKDTQRKSSFERELTLGCFSISQCKRTRSPCLPTSWAGITVF